MPVLVVAEVPGGTSEQDDALMEAMGLPSNPPDGGRFRLAGPMAGGWRVVALWESREQFETFMQDRLRPTLQGAGVQAPNVTHWDIEKINTWQEARSEVYGGR